MQPELIDPYDQLLTQMVDAHGLQATKQVLARMYGYEELPPTVEEFMDDKEFLGDVLWDRVKNQSSVYPAWRAGLKEIYPDQFSSPYMEVIATGSIGTGKTTLAKIGSLYDLCRLSYLKSPQEKYGLIRTTKIEYALINATLTLATGVLFDEIIEWFQSSPYFRRLLAKGTKKSLFPKNIGVVTGSRFGHVLGQAVVGAILSEVNFQNRIVDQAYNNYTNIKGRMESRFLKKHHDSLPGRMWLDSSKYDQASFLQQYVKNSVSDPKVKVFDYAIWEVLGHKNIYSGKTFKVFVGDRIRDPFIVERPEQTRNIDDALVIDVPIEYKRNFELDINNALRDLAGKGTSSVYTYITSAEKIEEALMRPNPISKDVVQLDFFDKEQTLMKYLDIGSLTDRSLQRFVHIDLGLRHDKAGIAMSHLAGFVEITRHDVVSGGQYRIREPIIYTDFIIPISPTPGSEVPIYKIKNFLIELSTKVPLALVTADGYQSENLKQDLILAGIASKILSVDRTRNPYDKLKNAILEGRYNGVRLDLFQQELIGLVDDGKKIDHPKKGSKDCSDAVAGTVQDIYDNMSIYSYSDINSYLDMMDQKSGQAKLYDQIMKKSALTVSSII